MRCTLTNRTIGMTSFSMNNPTIGINGHPSYDHSVTPMESICEYWTTLEFLLENHLFVSTIVRI